MSSGTQPVQHHTFYELSHLAHGIDDASSHEVPGVPTLADLCAVECADCRIPDPIECPVCKGACRVVEVEGDIFPAPWVAAGDGDFVRSGRVCGECEGHGAVEVDS